ncbi:MAG: hypothetical protein ACK58T_30075, partial [Phycisphaerae bacterium]
MSSSIDYHGRLTWRTTKSVEVLGVHIPVSESLAVNRTDEAGWNSFVAGIRPNSGLKSAIKSLLWPLRRASENILGHQFLQYRLAKWM